MLAVTYNHVSGENPGGCLVLQDTVLPYIAGYLSTQAREQEWTRGLTQDACSWTWILIQLQKASSLPHISRSLVWGCGMGHGTSWICFCERLKLATGPIPWCAVSIWYTGIGLHQLKFWFFLQYCCVFQGSELHTMGKLFKALCHVVLWKNSGREVSPSVFIWKWSTLKKISYLCSLNTWGLWAN